MGKVNLFRRLFSSLMDKGLILLLFVVVLVCISPFKMAGELGAYYALLGERPSAYSDQDTFEAMRHIYGSKLYESTESWVQCHDEIEKNLELVKPYEGITLNRDLSITGLFIVVNFLYYLLGEIVFSASLGKRMLGLIVVNQYDKRIRLKEAVQRCLFFLLTMVLAVAARFVFDVGYNVIIVLFFICMDVTVLINGKSLTDILSHTFVANKNQVAE